MEARTIRPARSGCGAELDVKQRNAISKSGGKSAALQNLESGAYRRFCFFRILRTEQLISGRAETVTPNCIANSRNKNDLVASRRAGPLIHLKVDAVLNESNHPPGKS